MEPDSSQKKKLNRHILLNQLIQMYPEILEVLIVEYGFHCVGCIFAEYETLEEGAAVHGIVGNDFTELLERLSQVIAAKEVSS